MNFFLCLIALVFSPLSFSKNLESLGLSGVQVFHGVNRSAWFQRDCKLVIMGTERSPVLYVSLSDSENNYTFWTYHPSFASGPGYDAFSVNLSDSMNLVAGSGGKIFSNLVEDSAEHNISEMILSSDSATGKLSKVMFRHLSPAKGKVLSEIFCDSLKLK